MSNPIPSGLVKRLMIESDDNRNRIKEKLNTHQGRMEVNYELIADGDVDIDEFNLLSSLSRKLDKVPKK